jgi:hypothetical protein
MAQKKEARQEAEVSQHRIRNHNRGMPVEAADWEIPDAALIRRVIAAVAKHHCAVQFGYTRDQGAYCVRIVGDGEPYNEYIRPTEDIDHYLEALALDFEDMVDK